MTDLTPNDLSHLSDEEFNALCPQGEHAPGAEPLSPAAQAVLDAAEPCIAPFECPGLEAAIAAALRAAADQVVPEGRACMIHMPETDVDGNEAGGMLLTAEPNARIRRDLLSIATELENYQ